MTGKAEVDDLFDIVAGSEAGDDADDEQAEIVLRVRVQPGAGRSEVIGRYGHGPGVAALKVKVAAPPEGGRANAAASDLLATTLGVSRNAVQLVAGETSRTKRFRIGPVDLDTARRLLLAAGGGAGGAGGRSAGGGWSGAGNARRRRGVR
jgi:uncharacterized protein (TIGR00251 family)